MSNAIFSIDPPKNEPVLSYAPESSERVELKKALEALKAKEIEIPLVIGGKEIKTGNMGTCVVPHDHGHKLATYHKAGAKEVAMAADAARAAAKSWLHTPWQERLAVFKKAAELIAGPYRMLLNAATMLGQGKNAMQAEIDAAEGPVTLVGSSLGGYYSTWLVEHNPGVRAVLVNPAVYPYRLLEDWLGNNANLYTEERYELTTTHLAQLKALDCPQLQDPSRYLLLVQTADETLDYREAVDKYAACVQFVQPGGSHGFEQFEALIPAVQAFAEGRIDLPAPTPLPDASL